MNKGTRNSNSEISRRLEKRFQDYASYHQTQGNQRCHTIGITLIVTSLLGLLSTLRFNTISPAELSLLQADVGIFLSLAAFLWYLFLDWKVAIPFFLVILGLYFMGRAIPSPVNWALFTTGWIFQGIGHAYYEKNSPAFFKNFEHLLIGPLWVFAKLTRYH
ncbi:MAG: DUF962 domain-containing protein [Bdellovibrio sp.]|nr:DUF962 domain-containing protein [Bdellovibrio sp.]